MLNNELIPIDPDNYVFKATEKQVSCEINMAVEIFIAEQFGKIHYQDLMNNVPNGCASKNRLIAWLNDYKGKNGCRQGIVNKYIEKRQDDFDNDIWQANRFCSFIKFLSKTLTDSEFTQSKKISNEFAKSFINKNWYWEAVAVSGLKLLENLYEHNALQTNIAKAYMEQVKATREMYSCVGKMIGRITKYHNASGMERDLQEIFEKTFKKKLEDSMKILVNTSEYQIYIKYKTDIIHMLDRIYSENEALAVISTHGSRQLSIGDK